MAKRECGLTPRSSGAPTAGHQAQVGGTLYIFTALGLASCRRRPLSSNVRLRRHTVSLVRRFFKYKCDSEMTTTADRAKQTPAEKALRTAKWARIMTKWLITRSSKGGVKWQVVSFNGPAGQESKGVVDMIAIRKKHSSAEGVPVGDLFEIILVQAKGGKSKFPSVADVARLEAVRKHHRADRVVLTEWKKGEKLCCYLLPDMKTAVPASEVFGKMPSVKTVEQELGSAAGDA